VHEGFREQLERDLVALPSRAHRRRA
jgi:hypothetical protein